MYQIRSQYPPVAWSLRKEISHYKFHYDVCLVTQSCPTLCEPWDCSLLSPLSMRILQAKILEGLPCPPPGYLPNPEIEPRSPALQEDSLLFEPSGKCKNTGVPNPGIEPGSPAF